MLVLACLCLALVPFAIAQNIPAEGVYVTLRNDFLLATGNDLSLQVSDGVNAYTQTPAVSGDTGSAKYTFDTFVYDIDLDGFSYSVNTPTITASWSQLSFIIQFNFHVCADSWPHPCDDGYALVYTTAQIGLNVDMTLSLSGSTVSLTATQVNLLFQQGQVQIFVQCTSSWCLVPVDDIANGIASNFQSTFQTTVLQEVNAVASSFVDSIPTSIPLPDFGGLTLNLKGNFDSYPAGTPNPNLIFYMDGEVTPNGQQPPFSPTTTPPMTVFQKPAGQIDFIFTDYLPRTGIWSLISAGDMQGTVTNADVPANSPIHLTSNDAFFQNAVPGLKSYPNMNIAVAVALVNTSSVDISPSGVEVTSTLSATFTLSNTTLSAPGWEILCDLGFSGSASVALSGGDIQIKSTVGGWSPSCYLTASSLGPITASLFGSAILLLLNADSPTPPVVTLPAITDFTVSSPFLNMGTGYMDVGAAIAYSVSVPGEACPGGSKTCPIQTTCCQWSGAWGCCTLPNAVCCDVGCCFPGEVCVQGGCQSDTLFRNFTMNANAHSSQPTAGKLPVKIH